MSYRNPALAACIAFALSACGGSDTPANTQALAPATLAAATVAPVATSAELAQVQAGGSRSLAVVTSSPAAERAMWTWYDTDVATTTKQNKMLDFAAARKLTHIYLHAETLLNKPAILTGFLNRAASRDIKVELLFGAAEWSLPENHYKAVNVLKKANTFVSKLTGARPVGYHFDIEPHGLAAWSTNSVTLGHNLLDLYAKLMPLKASGMYINADIAMGYEYVTLIRGGVTKTMSHWMVDATDRTTLMDYRDYSMGEDSIVSHADHPLDYALSRGKRTVVGVETTCNQTPEKISFCEEGRGHMDAELATVGNYFAGNAAFGGVAIHDYANYRLL